MLNQKLFFSQAILPSVAVFAGDLKGSGVIIQSRKRGKSNNFDTIVLTNAHVIKPNITIKKVWDHTAGESVDTEIFVPVSVKVPVYTKEMKIYHTIDFVGEIVYWGVYDIGRDYAFVRLKNDEMSLNRTAIMLPVNKRDDLVVGETVWAVNSEYVDNGPVITTGILSQKNITTNGNGIEYFLITAPSFYGASGGPVFRYSEKRRRFEIIGLSTLLATDYTSKPNDEKDEQGVPLVPHLHFVLPLRSIHQWALEDDEKIAAESIAEVK